jgi:hypothetical protein
MTETKTTLAHKLTRKMLRGVAVIVMLGVYGAGLIGVTGLMSAATSTEAAAWHRGRGYGRRGRGWWRGRGRRGRRGWWRGRGRRGRGWYGPGIHFYIR